MLDTKLIRRDGRGNLRYSSWGIEDGILDDGILDEGESGMTKAVANDSDSSAAALVKQPMLTTPPD